MAEVFTGSPGKYVTLEDTIRGLLPQQAFYMVDGIEEAAEKAKTLA